MKKCQQFARFLKLMNEDFFSVNIPFSLRALTDFAIPHNMLQVILKVKSVEKVINRLSDIHGIIILYLSFIYF